ncbi:MAG: phosphatase [Fusobacteriaceae bacterium]
MKSIIDLHTHTIVSGHAYSTLQENIEAACRHELKFLGVSDHAPAMPGGPHLFYFSNLKVIPKRINGVRILKGCEVNIINFNGEIDLPERELSAIDYAIASLHPPCIDCGDIHENTRAVINSMDIPQVKIIGHPDDSRYPLDYKEVVRAAKEKNVLLEINNSSLSSGSFREGARENLTEMLEECRKQGARVIMGSDAHASFDIGNFRNSEKLLKELNFPIELVINYNEEEIKDFFNIG